MSISNYCSECKHCIFAKDNRPPDVSNSSGQSGAFCNYSYKHVFHADTTPTTCGKYMPRE